MDRDLRTAWRAVLRPTEMAAIFLVLGFLAGEWLSMGRLVVQGSKYFPGLPVTAWSCPADTYYDRDGVRRILGSQPFQGPAPLYMPPAAAFPTDPFTGCPLYPDTIDPATLDLSQTVYPLHLDLAVRSSWMRLGESATLSGHAYLGDTFKGNAPAVLWPAGKVGDLVFKLDAPAFSFDTAPRRARLSLDQSADQEWVIAPRPETLGDQVIFVYLQTADTSDTLTAAQLRLDVRARTSWLAMLAAGTGVLGALVTLATQVYPRLLDLRRLYRHRRTLPAPVQQPRRSRHTL